MDRLPVPFPDVSAQRGSIIDKSPLDEAVAVRHTHTMADSPTYMLRLGDGTEFGPADLDLLEQWTRQGRVPRDGLLVSTADPAEVRSVYNEPRLARVLGAPPTTRVPVTAQPLPAGGLVPYHNPAALTAYYMGIFSLLPFIGVVLGIPAFILGIIGWRNYRRKPEIRGGVHAWIGIIMGGLLTLLWGGLGVAILIADTGY